ncbi:MAG: hypothetical protein ABGX07_04810, partial [Pirellulaceae bacterium]
MSTTAQRSYTGDDIVV